MPSRLFLFSLCLVFLAACGKKSTIKTHVEAQQLGDGQNITQPIVLPLSDKTIATYEADTDNIGPLFRGFVSTIMNLGASMGAGKTRLSLIQPIPEIPEDYVTSLKVKRIFFFIEDHKHKANFNFLRRIAVKMSPFKLEYAPATWEPIIETDSLNENELSTFRKLFKSQRDRHAEEWDKGSKGLLLLRYDEAAKADSIRNDSEGKVFIIETAKPQETRKFLDANFKEYYKRLHVLNKSILVELKKDPVIVEIFKTRLAEEASRVTHLEIGEIKPCSDDVCLDLKVPDSNLMPLLREGNAIKIDAYIDPRKAPKTFQLKGFIEFELKVPAKI